MKIDLTKLNKNFGAKIFTYKVNEPKNYGVISILKSMCQKLRKAEKSKIKFCSYWIICLRQYSS